MEAGDGEHRLPRRGRAPLLQRPPPAGPAGVRRASHRDDGGGGASKNQPRPTIAGQPIYVGERKLAFATCRDEVVEAVGVLAAGGGDRSFTVEEVYTVMVRSGTSWPRATVAKTMLRMTRPARRPPYGRLERAAANRYGVARAGDLS